MFKPSSTRLFLLSGRWGCHAPGVSKSTLILNLGWKFFQSIKTRLNLLGKVKNVTVHSSTTVVETQARRYLIKPFFTKENFLRFVSSSASQAYKSSRFASFRRGPLFLLSLTGIYFSSDQEWALEHGIVSKQQACEVSAQNVRKTIQIFDVMMRKAKTSTDADEKLKRVASVDELLLGDFLAKGSYGAIYPADLKSNRFESSDNFGKFPYAVKIMFNYEAVSHAPAILRSMFKETIPAQNIPLASNLSEWEFEELTSRPLLPPHPNLVSLHHVFVDRVPALPDALKLYPAALPPRINPTGYGRNMSLFLVMKRYDCSLRDYLQKGRPSNATSMIILTQILEGVTYLLSKGVAHRDIKSDNILLDLSYDPLKPVAVITDFGCCLADKDLGLTVPFRSDDTDRGGNASLMAPEVACAKPGPFRELNYFKYDSWAVGTVAYEIFGHENPFYTQGEKQLDSRTYNNSDLPFLDDGVPRQAQALIYGLLDRHYDSRLSAKKAASICQMFLWAPKVWIDPEIKAPSEEMVSKWLTTLATKVLTMKKWLENDPKFDLVVTFLKRATVKDCLDGIAFMRGI